MPTQSKKGRNYVPLTLLPFLILLQTFVSTLPGILLYRQQQGENWRGAFLLLFYIFVSNFSELGVRLLYRKQRSFPMTAYSIKIILCSVLILMYASNSQWQYALLLIAYELFQTLANSKQFFYLDSFYYTLLNPFFKGFVLNLLFLMKAPIFFDKKHILVLIPAFIASIVLTLFQQGQVTQRKRKQIFLLLFLVASLGFIVGSAYLYINHELFSIFRVILATLFTMSGTFIILNQRNFMKSETTLTLFYLLALFTLYI